MKQAIKIQNYAGAKAYFNVKLNEKGYFEPFSDEVSNKINDFMFTDKTKGFALVGGTSFFNDMLTIAGLLQFNVYNTENKNYHKVLPELKIKTNANETITFKYSSSIDAYVERSDIIPAGAERNMGAWYNTKSA